MAAQYTPDSRCRDESTDCVKSQGKIELQGFNNLTKSLSFNLYDICFAARPSTVREYIDYIDEAYNADRLTAILTEVTRIIDAEILNIARQDYHPQGASVTMLVAEEPVGSEISPASGGMLLSDAVVAHLDKSHICVHTYPESHPHNGISTFRADIDVSTCGRISPLRVLDFLLDSFESDIVAIDYRVRGFTRDVDGTKHYMDHEIESIRDFIAPQTLARYQALDCNQPDINVYHTRLMIEDLDLDNYLFGGGVEDLSQQRRREVAGELRWEMTEIFHGRNGGQ